MLQGGGTQGGMRREVFDRDVAAVRGFGSSNDERACG